MTSPLFFKKTFWNNGDATYKLTRRRNYIGKQTGRKGDSSTRK